ncbi:MAG: hypothetical protein LBV12_02250 [Puniceicoccales bacterium]|jgi:predicted Zn-dependent protease|nr:hypothetical protein [Puniceicoccales bacterium]
MKRSSFAATALISAIPFVSSAQSLPPANNPPPPVKETTSEAKIAPPDPEILFLTGLPLAGTPQEIITYSRRIYGRSGELDDIVLRSIIRFSLAKLEDNPADAEAIKQDHMKRISDYFFEVAIAAKNADNIQASGKAIQIAVRCNPGNNKAKIFWANMLYANNDIDGAIQTLQHGLPYLALSDPNAGAYLDRFFQFLQIEQRDREIAERATDLLNKGAVMSTYTREILGMHAAMASYWLGDYAKAIDLIQKNGLQKASQGRLYEARAYFDGRNTSAAISILDKAISDFSGAERDAILGQLIRFYTELGRYNLALSTLQQRIANSPSNPQPRIHRLYLLDKAGLGEQFDKELQSILNNYAGDQKVLMPLAKFAAERAKPNLAATCLLIANERAFNRQVFAAAVIEALIRDKRPLDAINFYKNVVAENKLYFNDTQASVNALLAAAYIAAKDASTGRAYLNEYLEETKDDPETKAKVDELLEQRDGTFDSRGVTIKPPRARTFEEKKRISDEIKRISRKRRDNAAVSFISVGRLLRSINAPEDALYILEAGNRMHPKDAQLKADYISARVVCDAIAEYGNRKALVVEVEELLQMRRPAPRVWNDVLLWLKTDNTLPQEKMVQLRNIAERLVRPDLVDEEFL